tara:strand:+ start:124 stop:729 length:606 start_codon:yes stop_codon:yes gene_type:complete
VQGVKGIFNAHKKCAEQAYTEMFYVVDADADLDDNFDLTYKPNKWDLDKIHVWRCRNPINDLIYGYGGVKLFPTYTLRDATDWKIDFTSSVGGAKKFKPMPPVSNTTRFNTDPFNTWKSAFRECTKLASKIIEEQKDDETNARLDIWCTKGEENEFGNYAIAGAKAGRQWGLDNKDNLEQLNLINDFDWLEKKFNEDTRNT